MNIGLMFIKEQSYTDREIKQRETDNLISDQFNNKNLFTKLATWIASTIGGPIISFFKKTDLELLLVF